MREPKFDNIFKNERRKIYEGIPISQSDYMIIICDKEDNVFNTVLLKYNQNIRDLYDKLEELNYPKRLTNRLSFCGHIYIDVCLPNKQNAGKYLVDIKM